MENITFLKIKAKEYYYNPIDDEYGPHYNELNDLPKFIDYCKNIDDKLTVIDAYCCAMLVSNGIEYNIAIAGNVGNISETFIEKVKKKLMMLEADLPEFSFHSGIVLGTNMDSVTAGDENPEDDFSF